MWQCGCVVLVGVGKIVCWWWSLAFKVGVRLGGW